MENQQHSGSSSDSISSNRAQCIPQDSLLRILEEETGQPLGRCYQCKKCSAGCPIAELGDLQTSEVIRLIQLGQRDQLLASNRIWLCLSCHTCEARCPNEIDTAAVIDVLKQMAGREPAVIADPKIPAFYNSFLTSVQTLGRLYEVGMIGLYKYKTGTYTDDLALGWEMLKRGKFKLIPERVQGIKEVRQLMARGREKG
ncbi:MAG: 4Fe-4S dicluster domain-containing protein [Carboxydocellales bacterium]